MTEQGEKGSLNIISQTMTYQEIEDHNKAIIKKYGITGEIIMQGYIPKSVTSGLRELVLRRDRYQCQDCFYDGLEDLSVIFDVHHIISPKDYGINHPINLVTLCKDCHIKRHGGRKKLAQQD